MGPNRKVDVPVYDLSVIRGIWEVRVKKQRTRQKKEQERMEKSALARSVTVLLKRSNLKMLIRTTLMFTVWPAGGGVVSQL